MLSNNIVIVAAAGSRKTTFVVEEALKDSSKKILIITYTTENLNQIREYIINSAGFIPEHILVQGWFTFLLHDCVRPYQNSFYDKKRIENIFFVEGKSGQYVKKDNIEKYFFSEGNRIYTDKISEFTCICNEKSGGSVIKRLTDMYDSIFIDEVQDLAGYDLDFLQILFNSSINVLAVGDTRQTTYATNYSPKNSRFKGKNIIDLFRYWEKNNLCKIQERNKCYRCNQTICDFADSLYPSMPKTLSMNTEITNHDGIFIVRSEDVYEYIKLYKPQVLRYKKSANTEGLRALNFGLSKGQSFSRVLIFPTAGIKYYLENNMLNDKVGDIPKFYVAITRARHSVAFVYDGESAIPFVSYYKQQD